MDKKPGYLYLTNAQMKDLIDHYTVTLNNGNMLVPSVKDVIRILKENYNTILKYKMKHEHIEYPHTKLDYIKKGKNILRGYDPNSIWIDETEIKNEMERLRIENNKKMSAESQRKAMEWALKLGKKYPKKRK
jgi:multimeric flavodoxin WrbA